MEIYVEASLRGHEPEQVDLWMDKNGDIQQ
jgi:hypothetical protein